MTVCGLVAAVMSGRLWEKTNMFQDQWAEQVARVDVAPPLTANGRRLARRTLPDKPRHIIKGLGDMTDCDSIRGFFVRCARSIDDGCDSLVIDLNQVQRADTKLMACLIAVFQHARAASVKVELWSSDAVLDMIEFCKLRWLLEYSGIED
jgi:ABC-type transporter Mla MlaB component